VQRWIGLQTGAGAIDDEAVIGEVLDGVIETVIAPYRKHGGRWSTAEDARLSLLVTRHESSSPFNWTAIASNMGTRSGDHVARRLQQPEREWLRCVPKTILHARVHVAVHAVVSNLVHLVDSQGKHQDRLRQMDEAAQVHRVVLGMVSKLAEKEESTARAEKNDAAQIRCVVEHLVSKVTAAESTRVERLQRRKRHDATPAAQIRRVVKGIVSKIAAESAQIKRRSKPPPREEWERLWCEQWQHWYYWHGESRVSQWAVDHIKALRQAREQWEREARDALTEYEARKGKDSIWALLEGEGWSKINRNRRFPTYYVPGATEESSRLAPTTVEQQLMCGHELYHFRCFADVVRYLKATRWRGLEQRTEIAQSAGAAAVGDSSLALRNEDCRSLVQQRRSMPIRKAKLMAVQPVPTRAMPSRRAKLNAMQQSPTGDNIAAITRPRKAAKLQRRTVKQESLSESSGEEDNDDDALDPIFAASLGIGTSVQAKDAAFKQWYEAVVIETNAETDQVKVHFRGWRSKFDAWYKRGSRMLRPGSQPDSEEECPFSSFIAGCGNRNAKPLGGTAAAAVQEGAQNFDEEFHSRLQEAKARERNQQLAELHRQQQREREHQKQHLEQLKKQEQERQRRRDKRQQRLTEIQRQHELEDLRTAAEESRQLQGRTKSRVLSANSPRVDVGTLVSVEFINDDAVPIPYDGHVLSVTAQAKAGRHRYTYRVQFFADDEIASVKPDTHVMRLVCSPDPANTSAKSTGNESAADEDRCGTAQCMVCLDDFAAMPGNKSVTILGCGHRYCTECIEDWFKRAAKRSCPTCRKCFAGLRQATTAAVADIAKDTAAGALSDKVEASSADRLQKRKRNVPAADSRSVDDGAESSTRTKKQRCAHPLILAATDVGDAGASYDIQALLARRPTTRCRGHSLGHPYEYRVRWLGHGEAADTWEPAANLTSAERLVSEFDRREDLIGRRVRKRFLGYGVFDGTVTGQAGGLLRVLYDDGELKHVRLEKLLETLLPSA
jgi:hypothetical protein